MSITLNTLVSVLLLWSKVSRCSQDENTIIIRTGIMEQTEKSFVFPAVKWNS